MTYQMNKVLITGGAGFIGANYVNYQLKNHNEIFVVNLDKLTYAGSMDNIKTALSDSRHKFIKEDIVNQHLIENIIRDYEIDTIVHFAAESHVDRSIADPSAFIKTNILGTYSLLEAAKKVWLNEQKRDATNCRFHHISTDEVYGSLSKTDPAFKETNAYEPNSPYSASKASSDHLVRAYHHTFGLPVTTSNCSNNYGPMQHQEKLIPTIIKSCVMGQSIPIYGDGSNIRDWLFVEDHCNAINAIIQKGKVGETYNVGGNEEHNNLDIATSICKVLAKIKKCDANTYLDLITFVKDRPGHDWRYAIDAGKIYSQLGWQPAHSFIEGIEKTIEWYLTHKF